jgi:hypothetical protein
MHRPGTCNISKPGTCLSENREYKTTPKRLKEVKKKKGTL